MRDVSELSGAELISSVLDQANPNRTEAGVFLLKNPPPPDCLPPAEKLQIRSIVSMILSRDALWAASWNLCVFYASLVQTYCDGEAGSRMMLTALEKGTNFKLCLQLLFHIRVFCFLHNICLDAEIWQAYFRLSQGFSRDMPPLNITPQEKRAIVLTSQMLDPPHQPTVDVIAMANILEQDFGYDVAVVNTYENPDHCDLPVIHAKISQRLPQYAGCQTDTVHGIRVFTPDRDMPSADGYRQICEFVQFWQPKFILSFGSMNFSAEYLGNFAHVISMQAGTDLVPTRSSGHLVTFRSLQESDLKLLDMFGMAGIPRVRTTYCYGKPEITRRYQRKEFDLSDDDLVFAVVGNRLPTELNDDNLRLLSDVLACDDRIRIIFAGNLEDEDQSRIRGQLPPDRMRFPGFVDDVPSFLANICDGYLNPVRFGNGGSAAYALAAGVPVFTLNVGHVAANTHPDFIYPSEESLLAGVKRFAAGIGRAEAAAKARDRFAEISDRRVMLRDILTGAGLPADLKEKAAAE